MGKTYQHNPLAMRHLLPGRSWTFRRRRTLPQCLRYSILSVRWPPQAPRDEPDRGAARGRGVRITAPMLIVQFTLTGVIGLAAGCFILFLVNPQHPLIASLYKFLHPPQVELTKDHNQPDPKVPEKTFLTRARKAAASTRASTEGGRGALFP